MVIMHLYTFSYTLLIENFDSESECLVSAKNSDSAREIARQGILDDKGIEDGWPINDEGEIVEKDDLKLINVVE